MSFIANIKCEKSHLIVSDALTILENMEHKGGRGSEGNTGDGSGILIQTPHEFLFDECIRIGVHLPPYGKYGVGVLFFSKNIRLREECRDVFSRCAETLGLEIIGYRKVPVNNQGIGATALANEPEIEQVFIACPDHIQNADDFERKLYVLRNYSTQTIHGVLIKEAKEFYITSLSHRTIVYKGQLSSDQLRNYYPDLTNKRLVSAFGIVHSRFATNTFPAWSLAQPFRIIAHKGEISSYRGNLNWLKAFERYFTAPYFTKEEMDMLLPIVQEGQSDSASLDNIVELLLLCGRSLPHVMMMLIPEPWDGNDKMDPIRRAFYEFHSAVMEPWDGPALISFTDGKVVGAVLDRNGLHTARYCLTTDNRVILALESGVLPIDQAIVKEKGILQPGKMFMVDLEGGRVVSDSEIKDRVCSQKPYAEWLNKYKIHMNELPLPRVMFTHLEQDQVFHYQKAFGYTTEDLDLIIAPMALYAKEPTGSMGNDTPLAVLSNQPQHLSHYFKQLFAQVTNPPIDPIFEKIAMSLSTFVGNSANLLLEDPLACHSVFLKHPVLSNTELEKIRSIDTGIFQSKTLAACFVASGRPNALQNALDQLCRYAVDAIEDGYEILIISDRAIDSDHAAIPSLLATAAVHHHLIRKGLRGKMGLVVEAGDVWEVHHFACLIGFGATAINPYLALSSIRDMMLKGRMKTELDSSQLRKNYIKAVNDGLFKVFAKMGVSTLQSYQGAQLFEIIGFNKSVVDKYFTGTASRIEGMDLDEIAREILIKHFFSHSKGNILGDRLTVGGIYQWRRKGEYHLFNPQTIHLLQYSTRMQDYNIFKKYSKLVNTQSEKAATLRGLLKFKHNRPSISIDEVEPAENIYKRFSSGGMSFGAISWEAHTTLAIAMNRLGGKSNTGEGGEDEVRYQPLFNGDSMKSAIKQIAPARFGVTSQYLNEAAEFQIKIAQGAKPGEGGQLPGYKVDEWIGMVRHSIPGKDLMSPPAHHDIYCIGDLAQLVYDLKNANRDARISVKLVSNSGIGTVSTDVAKAKADIIVIEGHEGGTGSSPISSVKHAGLPWEIGLAEAHQTLIRNKCRNRITIRVEGQLTTGRDIAIATLLGAEEWGIATAALIVEGCIMMRKCHLNTCPVGVATQDPELRNRFTGNPDHIVNFFKFITEELREIMAELGFRSINEMVGQVNFLEKREYENHFKLNKLDLSAILYNNDVAQNTLLYKTEKQDHGLSNALDWTLVEAARPAIEKREKIFATFEIKNTNRTVGTILSNEISRKYKNKALPDNTVHFKFVGTAGQSFGAFSTRGITLELEGDANDYFGKSLSGGRLIAYPSKHGNLIPEENIIVGNAAFYGATSGEAYIRGRAGARFCLRNSGALIVVEGVGDHGCEYMTDGCVIVLGESGRNFAAGMSGGVAYIYDLKRNFESLCNKEMVDMDVLNSDDETFLKDMIKKHFTYTGSTVANFFLNDLGNQIKNFVKIFPKDFKRHQLDTGARQDNQDHLIQTITPLFPVENKKHQIKIVEDSRTNSQSIIPGSVGNKSELDDLGEKLPDHQNSGFLHNHPILLNQKKTPATLTDGMSTSSKMELQEKYHSIFISHSLKDKDFAKVLFERLRLLKMEVFFSPIDMQPGKKIVEQIEEAIEKYDKLLLILSENSIRSEWVAYEIKRAIEEEKEKKSGKLFPISLIDYNVLKEWKRIDPKTGLDIADEVRGYYIPDFSNWKDSRLFEEEFDRLVRSLRAE